MENNLYTLPQSLDDFINGIFEPMHECIGNPFKEYITIQEMPANDDYLGRANYTYRKQILTRWEEHRVNNTTWLVLNINDTQNIRKAIDLQTQENNYPALDEELLSRYEQEAFKQDLYDHFTGDQEEKEKKYRIYTALMDYGQEREYPSDINYTRADKVEDFYSTVLSEEG